ncbi:class I SAM-dependent methyltransferase [Herbivorax sp. ANBcel31]|uniref:class I SAM-dependent methyltransferase n=1 Tax=Herbivorax sp. ANBcel31 TaxID=3069754 RepID=UPI0027B16749|nr:class I SAM-dependent methyltransferase [Herbivorax sp. ANBcel31]MDQ2087999.1 class I SAM-dependent methyltransferase [Herbivorax sp. ANBcel31]
MSNNSTPHVSKAYDSQVRKTIPYYDLFLKETIDIVDTINPNPDLWLDTGCGTGNMVELALDYFKKTKFMLADPSHEMIRVSKNKLRERDRINFIGTFPTQDLCSIDIKTPNVITAVQCHHYLDKSTREKATQVCFNLLSDNGIYVTFENICPSTEVGVNYVKERWAKYQISQLKDKTDTQNHIKRFGVNYFPITIEEHIELLKKTGFKTVELLWLSYMQAGFYGVK